MTVPGSLLSLISRTASGVSLALRWAAAWMHRLRRSVPFSRLAQRRPFSVMLMALRCSGRTHRGLPQRVVMSSLPGSAPRESVHCTRRTYIPALVPSPRLTRICGVAPRE